MNKSNINFAKPSQQQLNSLLEYYQTGQYSDAEKLAISITKQFPEHQFAWKVLGAVLKQTGKISESLVASQKSLQLNPQDAEAHNNLGNILVKLKKLEEAEKSYKKAIELKLDYAEVHYNLGILLNKIGRRDEAEINYKKAIKLKPDYIEAYNNLGNNLTDLARLEDAEVSYRKAIELKPDYAEAYDNLDIVLKLNKLSLEILHAKKSVEENAASSITSDIRLTSNPFISKKDVEPEIITSLYKMKSIQLDKKEKHDARYGNGKCSFQLFENDCSIINTVEKDLINIMSQAVKSDIYIMESFFNIFRAGSGTTPHNHLSNFDMASKLANQKFSLVYYLSAGDQNCSDPGILNLYDPDEEILPSEGMIAIFPAGRMHSSVYSGKTDRVMIGVNFYSLI